MDGSMLISGGMDSKATVLGLRARRAVREFPGHTSFVSGIENLDARRVVTACSDGMTRGFRLSSGDPLFVIAPPRETGLVDPPLVACLPLPGSQALLVVPRSDTARMYALPSRAPILVLRSDGIIELPKDATAAAPSGWTVEDDESKKVARSAATGPAFVAAALSPLGSLAALATEDHRLIIFDLNHRRTAAVLALATKDAPPEKQLLGLAFHPHKNLLATWNKERKLRLWTDE